MKIVCAFEKPALYFDNPVSVIACFSFEDVPRSFEKIEDALAQGLYVAGFFPTNWVTRLKKHFLLTLLTVFLLYTQDVIKDQGKTMIVLFRTINQIR